MCFRYRQKWCTHKKESDGKKTHINRQELWASVAWESWGLKVIHEVSRGKREEGSSHVMNIFSEQMPVSLSSVSLIYKRRGEPIPFFLSRSIRENQRAALLTRGTLAFIDSSSACMSHQTPGASGDGNPSHLLLSGVRHHYADFGEHCGYRSWQGL